MRQILVAYFSASGVTARVAEELAELTGGALYEIQPEVPYSKEDLDWRNEKSRSSVEMKDLSFRPAITGRCAAVDNCDTLFLGFPIWWYQAPTIINTFLEDYDLKGKTILPFATSGTSDMGKTNEFLMPSCPGARLLEGRRIPRLGSRAALKTWLETLSL